MRASQACGPLLVWALAQLRYATMLHSIEPLTRELGALEAATAAMRAQVNGLLFYPCMIILAPPPETIAHKYARAVFVCTRRPR